MNLLNNWVKGREEKREQYRQMPKRNFTKKKKKSGDPGEPEARHRLGKKQREVLSDYQSHRTLEMVTLKLELLLTGEKKEVQKTRVTDMHRSHRLLVARKSHRSIFS